MFLIAVLILILAIGTVLALWSMREYVPVEESKSIKSSKGGDKKVQLRGEVKLEGRGEIILPRGQKRI